MGIPLLHSTSVQTTRIRTILTTPILLLLLGVRSAWADPFIPKMNEPESYKDIKFGLQEVRDNMATAQCGGFDPGSEVKIVKEADPSTCQLNIQCHSNVGPCHGIVGGFAQGKGSDGSISLDFCFPPGIDGTSAVEATFVHELTHAMQNCPVPPGTDVTGGTREGCCATESEAYSAQCGNEASQGLFDTPEAVAAGLNGSSCVHYGINKVSCTAYDPDGGGPQLACPGDGSVTADINSQAFEQAYANAALALPGPTCEQMKANPTPPVKALMDQIDAMSSEESPYKVKCIDDGKDCVPIPDISPDLPGRENIDPLAHAVFGLSERGEFEYPERTWGFSSVCDTKSASYGDPDVGNVPVNPDRLCLRFEKATPTWCKELYEQFRAWSNGQGPVDRLGGSRPTRTCDVTYEAKDAAGKTIDVPIRYVFKKTFCWDFTTECFGNECRNDILPNLPMPQWDMSATPPTLVVPVKNFPPNCAFNKKTGVLDNPPQLPTEGAKSFYRHYTIAQESLVTLTAIRNGINAVYPFGMGFEDARDRIDNDAGDGGVSELWRGVTIKTPNGEKTWEVRAECYETYTENDPKTYETTFDDEKCEIIIGPNEQTPDPPEWPSGAWKPSNPNAQREQTAPAVDVSEAPRSERQSQTPEPWISDSTTNLALLDMKKVKDLQRNFEDPSNISGQLDAMIPAKVAASKTVPDNARIDAFDDSAIRKFTKWWELQEKALLKIVKDPTIKLIMPGRFLVGLSDSDPLYRLPRKILTQPVGAVELTLNAGSEDFGNVMQSMRQQFTMPVETVPVPIYVPLVSEPEIDARIEEFKQWRLVNPDAAFEDKYNDIIQKLEQYKSVVKRVRVLREALPYQLSRIYAAQYQLRNWFGQWYAQNATLLLEFAKDSTERQKAKLIWRHITQSMLLADSCQINWCQNQRFSDPVYSLQDSWLRGPESTGLPDIVQYVIDQPDLSFDFSSIGLAADSMQIPVLQVNFVPVNLPPVPTLRGAAPVAVDNCPTPDSSDFDECYPDLVMPPDPSVFDFVNVPNVQLPNPTLISGYTPPDLGAVKDQLRKVRKIVDGTTEEEQIAQEEQELMGNVTEQQITYARNTMMGAYCRFQPSVLIPPHPQDRIGYAAKIIHVENDLNERAQRLWSRWMPNRKEDFAGKVARLGNVFKAKNKKPECKENVVCAPLPPEMVVEAFWQMFTPETTGEIDEARNYTEDTTLPENDEENPFDADLPTLERAFPALSLPMIIDLLPLDTSP